MNSGEGKAVQIRFLNTIIKKMICDKLFQHHHHDKKEKKSHKIGCTVHKCYTVCNNINICTTFENFVEWFIL